MEIFLSPQIIHYAFPAPPAVYTGTYTVLTAESAATADFDNHVYGTTNEQIRYPVITAYVAYFLQAAANNA